VYTGLDDEILVQLAREPDANDIIRVKVVLDDDSQQALTISSLDPRFDAWTVGDSTYYTIVFDGSIAGDWESPVRIVIQARDDAKREDPQTAVLSFQRDDDDADADLLKTTDPDGDYPFPNLRSGLGLQDVEVIDDETAGMVLLESGIQTVVTKCGNLACTIPGPTDDYFIRLTRQPEDPDDPGHLNPLETVEVAILTDGMVDVISIGGVPTPISSYSEIGGLVASQRFLGNLTVDGDTISRANGSDLGSFFDEGFAPGQFIRITVNGTSEDLYISSDPQAVQDDEITLASTPTLILDDTYENATIGDLANVGKWDGTVEIEITGGGERRLVRPGLSETELPGWLSDGFLEGQWVEVCDDTLTCARLKIAIIRGDNEDKDTKLEFTVTGAFPWADGAMPEVAVARLAAVAIFTDDDWYLSQDIVLEADVDYEVPIQRRGVKVFPVSTHLLSKLRGPLAVEGGVTGADRSLQLGLKLPGEADGPLFAIATQAPESKQIDVLNIFNDGSKQDRTGTLTSTNLEGFGMAKDLDFGGLFSSGNPQTFGEPPVFPGGISFGSVQFVDGKFQTDGAKTTIEVLNLMLGEGNDNLDIQGTLDPDVPVRLTGTILIANTADGIELTRSAPFDWKAQGFLVGQIVEIEDESGTNLGSWTVKEFDDYDLGDTTDNTVMRLTGAMIGPDELLAEVTAADVPVSEILEVTVAGGEFGGTITRTDGGDWEQDGFLVGQLVMVQGFDSAWRLQEFQDGGSTMRLGRGGLLPSIAVPELRNVFVPGPHGGLTVVHGGGNFALEIEFDMQVAADSLTRLDGLSWSEAGFQVGDRVQISGEAQTHTISAIGGDLADCPFVDPFPGCGVGSVLELDGAALTPSASVELTVHVSDPLLESFTGDIEIHTSSLVRIDGQSWDASTGFEDGQQIWIEGIAGPWTIDGIADSSFGTGTVLNLQGAALTPTFDYDTLALTGIASHATVKRTVFGFDPVFDSADGARMGGDRITLCSDTAVDDVGEPVECGDVLAGPDSPLVVYGDTSQDGVWYSGHAWDVLGAEFGPKPFDPFVSVPDGENEDDEWIHPLADPFKSHGNDIIDGSRLFADLVCDLTSCNLPTVGFTAYGGIGDDIIIGSQTGDHLAGGSGNDLILGLRGVDHIYGDGGVNVDIHTRALRIADANASPRPSLDPTIGTNGTTVDPSAPSPVRDFMAAGRDEIYGEGEALLSVGSVGTVDDIGPQIAYDDVIFGDHGQVLQQVVDPNEPDTRLQKIQTTLLASIRFIESRAYQNGNDDTIFGNIGRDVIVAGSGHDMADGDEQDDLIFGDNVFLTRRVIGEPEFPANTDWTGIVDITSGRFQALCGDLLYSRTDRVDSGGDDECGNAVNADNSGVLLTDGVWQDFRDPDSPGIDDWPWWAEYQVFFDKDDTDDDHFHTFEVDDGDKGAGSFGNDYLAGGPQNDLVYGQMGDDIMQGDGSIDTAFNATAHVGVSRTPDGCVAEDTPGENPTHAGTCDFVGDLDLVPSFDAETDGEDYVEGNAGNDIAFGGLGQDDIVGGNSDHNDLDKPNERPDGSDLLFGGSGVHVARNDNGGVDPGLPVPDGRHASDADVIVGDNGRIIRIVGTDSTDVCSSDGCQDGETLYVEYEYDVNYAARLVVRGVTLLDYTPGGPDFRPDRFGLGLVGPCSTAGSETFGDCSERLTMGPDRNDWEVQPGDAADGMYHREIAANDEVHGGLSDDTIFTGGGNDVAFGDADDDDIILGWGTDWASGGVGQDGILGDDGRIFTSRNSDAGWDAAGNPCTGSGDGTCYSEPLYGITAFQPQGTCTENKSVLCGDFLDQYISTPGQVQTAVINIAGDLKKTVDLTPFNLTPNVSGADQALFDANNSDDVIFGGLGGEILPNYPTEIGHRNNEDPPFGEQRGIAGDFLHGGAGDDAMAGGEAIWNAYTQIYDLTTGELLPNAYRSDWTRPFNPGDLLHFGEDHDAWHDTGPIVTRLGEFALYDEYDPRRTILLNADGTVDKDDAEPNIMWFLNLFSNEGPTLNGCVEYLPNGTCVTYDLRNSDGGDVIAGDLGNDWLVGGTGQDTMYGGWGNDLLNSDDVMTIEGEGEFGDQRGRKIQPSPNDTPDTHPLYQDRAFGGAGLDILIANTGGDRNIDWVGEFNSYIVPFAPFGIATNSRQVPPWLFEFLYALSASQGIDPTRATDTGNDADRNGEPDGELGLVTQKDKGLWQDQTGGPSDPQPGNIPGGPRDVLRSADFNGGEAMGFVADSGTWSVTGGRFYVAPEELGGDAVSVFYADVYFPTYFELLATINADKPTGGAKANTYLIFDYQGPDDFKFAGINVSIDKLQIGYRDAEGWHVVDQTPAKLKPNTDYDMLLALNGTTATLVVDNKEVFAYAFAPRVDEDGFSYGLNAGMIGIGTDNSSGSIDNVAIQVLPPEITLEETEDFKGGAGDRYMDEVIGDWTLAAQRYDGSPAPGDQTALSVSQLAISSSSLLELQATLETGAVGGVVFDYYGPEDYKFAALSPATDEVLVGHYVGRQGWTVDAVATRTLLANKDHTLTVSLKGLTVSVYVNGQAVLGHVYNGIVVDGGFGLLSNGGESSFDDVTLKTNDPAYAPPPEGEALLVAYAPLTDTEPVPLTIEDLLAIVPAAFGYWVDDLGDQGIAGLLGQVEFQVAELGGLELGRAQAGLITIDSTAAGHGWTLDTTASGAEQIDLLATLIHEMGHVLGQSHVEGPWVTMSPVLSSGLKVFLEGDRGLGTTGSDRRLSNRSEAIQAEFGNQISMDAWVAELKSIEIRPVTYAGAHELLLAPTELSLPVWNSSGQPISVPEVEIVSSGVNPTVPSLGSMDSASEARASSSASAGFVPLLLLGLFTALSSLSRLLSE
jgi:Ca2+-binding RTX toxin-like protein